MLSILIKKFETRTERPTKNPKHNVKLEISLLKTFKIRIESINKNKHTILSGFLFKSISNLFY